MKKQNNLEQRIENLEKIVKTQELINVLQRIAILIIVLSYLFLVYSNGKIHNAIMDNQIKDVEVMDKVIEKLNNVIYLDAVQGDTNKVQQDSIKLLYERILKLEERQ